MIRRLFSTILDTSAQLDMSPLKGKPLSGTFGVKRLESLDWLHTQSICFPMQASQVEIITDPQTFYHTLHTMCTNAFERIGIASLYLGTDKLESQLIDDIQQNIRRNSTLKVNALIDFARGTRGEGHKTTSKDMFRQLMVDNGNCTLSLYHTPNLRGLTKRIVPNRWNELIGLQHMKVYVADNTVIISGANLSNDYFRNRQDRYISINDKRLSDFYFGLIERIQEFSVQVSATNTYQAHPKWERLAYLDDKKQFVERANQSICKYFADAADDLKCELNTMANTMSPARSQRRNKIDTWIFPFIEMGQLGIHHDSIVTDAIFAKSLPGSRIHLTTGYFNLTQTYMDTIIAKCQAYCDILMAHPNANGFQGAKGVAGGIPAAYSQISKKFLQHIAAANQSERIKMFEFERNGWTYHAKGLWYYLPGSYMPDLTLIGSSNFGDRSVQRDLESQICLVTVNNELQRQLQREYVNLKRYCAPAEQEIRTRIIPNWVKATVAFFKSFF